MKLGKKIKSACNKLLFDKIKFKFDADYNEYKKVIKALNTIRCNEVLENEEGYMLPQNLGRIIILKTKPRVKQVYSMTRPGTKISNLHSFGWIYRVFHKEKILMRYPELFKFRAHRANMKVPLYEHIMNQTKDYLRLTDFN